MEGPLESVTKSALRLGIKPADRLLVVRLGPQTLQAYSDGELRAAYAVSTSRKPPSNVRGSLGTPLGLHAIAARIGGEQPIGVVFRARVPTGRHYLEPGASDGGTDDLITSRILWLRGLEPGWNAGGEVDTYARTIYIHGTRHEDRIGSPASAGCIRMRNRDIVELYETVRTGDWVWIGE
jgi:hypothetical protein